jgi:hypothetical protein
VSCERILEIRPARDPDMRSAEAAKAAERAAKEQAAKEKKAAEDANVSSDWTSWSGSC